MYARMVCVSSSCLNCEVAISSLHGREMWGDVRLVIVGDGNLGVNTAGKLLH